jgi:hypothetical protein
MAAMVLGKIAVAFLAVEGDDNSQGSGGGVQK